jgi:single-stranded-DNA-specific exonuclease
MVTLKEAAVVNEEVVIDAELTLEEVNAELVKQLTLLAPYGTGNPKPLFAFREVSPQSVELFGKAKEHTKLTFQSKGGRLEAIAFFRTPEQFLKVPQANTALTVLAHVEQSFFMGRRQIRLRIVEIL